MSKMKQNGKATPKQVKKKLNESAANFRVDSFSATSFLKKKDNSHAKASRKTDSKEYFNPKFKFKNNPKNSAKTNVDVVKKNKEYSYLLREAGPVINVAIFDQNNNGKLLDYYQYPFKASIEEYENFNKALIDIYNIKENIPPIKKYQSLHSVKKMKSQLFVIDTTYKDIITNITNLIGEKEYESLLQELGFSGSHSKTSTPVVDPNEIINRVYKIINAKLDSDYSIIKDALKKAESHDIDDSNKIHQENFLKNLRKIVEDCEILKNEIRKLSPSIESKIEAKEINVDTTSLDDLNELIKNNSKKFYGSLEDLKKKINDNEKEFDDFFKNLNEKINDKAENVDNKQNEIKVDSASSQVNNSSDEEENAAKDLQPPSNLDEPVEREKGKISKRTSNNARLFDYRIRDVNNMQSRNFLDQSNKEKLVNDNLSVNESESTRETDNIESYSDVADNNTEKEDGEIEDSFKENDTSNKLSDTDSADSVYEGDILNHKEKIEEGDPKPKHSEQNIEYINQLRKSKSAHLIEKEFLNNIEDESVDPRSAEDESVDSRNNLKSTENFDKDNEISEEKLFIDKQVNLMTKTNDKAENIDNKQNEVSDVKNKPEIELNSIDEQKEDIYAKYSGINKIISNFNNLLRGSGIELIDESEKDNISMKIKSFLVTLNNILLKNIEYLDQISVVKSEKIENFATYQKEMNFRYSELIADMSEEIKKLQKLNINKDQSKVEGSIYDETNIISNNDLKKFLEMLGSAKLYQGQLKEDTDIMMHYFDTGFKWDDVFEFDKEVEVQYLEINKIISELNNSGIELVYDINLWIEQYNKIKFSIENLKNSILSDDVILSDILNDKTLIDDEDGKNETKILIDKQEEKNIKSSGLIDKMIEEIEKLSSSSIYKNLLWKKYKYPITEIQIISDSDLKKFLKELEDVKELENKLKDKTIKVKEEISELSKLSYDEDQIPEELKFKENIINQMEKYSFFNLDEESIQEVQLSLKNLRSQVEEYIKKIEDDKKEMSDVEEYIEKIEDGEKEIGDVEEFTKFLNEIDQLSLELEKQIELLKKNKEEKNKQAPGIPSEFEKGKISKRASNNARLFDYRIRDVNNMQSRNFLDQSNKEKLVNDNLSDNESESTRETDNIESYSDVADNNTEKEDGEIEDSFKENDTSNKLSDTDSADSVYEGDILNHKEKIEEGGPKPKHSEQNIEYINQLRKSKSAHLIEKEFLNNIEDESIDPRSAEDESVDSRNNLKSTENFDKNSEIKVDSASSEMNNSSDEEENAAEDLQPPSHLDELVEIGKRHFLEQKEILSNSLAKIQKILHKDKKNDDLFKALSEKHSNKVQNVDDKKISDKQKNTEIISPISNKKESVQENVNLNIDVLNKNIGAEYSNIDEIISSFNKILNQRKVKEKLEDLKEIDLSEKDSKFIKINSFFTGLENLLIDDLVNLHENIVDETNGREIFITEQKNRNVSYSELITQITEEIEKLQKLNINKDQSKAEKSIRDETNIISDDHLKGFLETLEDIKNYQNKLEEETDLVMGYYNEKDSLIISSQNNEEKDSFLKKNDEADITESKIILDSNLKNSEDSKKSQDELENKISKVKEEQNKKIPDLATNLENNNINQLRKSKSTPLIEKEFLNNIEDESVDSRSAEDESVDSRNNLKSTENFDKDNSTIELNKNLLLKENQVENNRKNSKSEGIVKKATDQLINAEVEFKADEITEKYYQNFCEERYKDIAFAFKEYLNKQNRKTIKIENLNIKEFYAFLRITPNIAEEYHKFIAEYKGNISDDSNRLIRLNDKFKDKMNDIEWVASDEDFNNRKNEIKLDGKVIYSLNEKRYNADVNNEYKINRYRIIDLDSKLKDSARGPMHLFLIAHDADGNEVSEKDYLSLNLHFGKNGKIESLNIPYKLFFPIEDGPATILKDGKIFTFPITKSNLLQLLSITQNGEYPEVGLYGQKVEFSEIKTEKSFDDRTNRTLKYKTHRSLSNNSNYRHASSSRSLK